MLNYDKYFKFNILTKLKIEQLYKGYVYDFTLKSKQRYTSMMCLYAYPLVDELKKLYNNELALSASTAQVLCGNKKISVRVKAFHIENAFTRISSIWDYIFIAINEYMQTELIASRHNKEEIIKSACIYKIPIVENDITRIISQPMEEEKQKEIQKKLRKQLVVITGSKLHKCIKDKYSYSEDLEKIFNLYESGAVNEMKELRNDITHSGNLGANFSITSSDFISNQAMSSKNVDFNSIRNIIIENMSIVKQAIEILNEFIINDKIPNRKGNENKEYYINQCKCNDCGCINCYADEIFGMVEKKLNLICLECGSLNVDANSNEKNKISEPVHDDILIRNIEKMSEILNS